MDDTGSAVARDVPFRLPATVPSGVAIWVRHTCPLDGRGVTTDESRHATQRRQRREDPHGLGRCAAQPLCGDAVARWGARFQLDLAVFTVRPC